MGEVLFVCALITLILIIYFIKEKDKNELIYLKKLLFQTKTTSRIRFG